jgi:uncharacterized protein
MTGRRIGMALLITLLTACSAQSPPPPPPSATPPATSAPTTTAAPTTAAPPATATAAPQTVEPETTARATSSSTTPGTHTVPTRNPALDQALIDAAWANDVNLARQLISQGADVNAKDSTVQSAYLIATSEGYDELLELTMASGADLASLDSYRGTGLIRAAERGHSDIVGRLLRAGIDVNHVNRLEWTALDEAIVYGDGGPNYVNTVRALVAGGADLERVAGDGRTPLQHARDGGQDVIVKTLQSAIEAMPLDPSTAAATLLQAAADGDPDRVALALRAGASIESRDGQGRTPLLLASVADNLDVARLLVVLGADPDAQDNQRDSAWLVTGVTGSVAMLEILLPAHPDLALRNRFGGISVIPASERGHVEYVRRVVTTGINLNHVNDLGWTALLEAIVLGDGSEPYQQIVGILLDAGADPAIADNDGVTPLQHAQRRGFGIIAARLQAAGG